jgi:hypothetical protein
LVVHLSGQVGSDRVMVGVEDLTYGGPKCLNLGCTNGGVGLKVGKNFLKRETTSILVKTSNLDNLRKGSAEPAYLHLKT